MMHLTYIDFREIVAHTCCIISYILHNYMHATKLEGPIYNERSLFNIFMYGLREGELTRVEANAVAMFNPYNYTRTKLLALNL